jgi:hypothetical protein
VQDTCRCGGELPWKKGKELLQVSLGRVIGISTGLWLGTRMQRHRRGAAAARARRSRDLWAT